MAKLRCVQSTRGTTRNKPKVSSTSNSVRERAKTPSQKVSAYSSSTCQMKENPAARITCHT